MNFKSAGSGVSPFIATEGRHRQARAVNHGPAWEVRPRKANRDWLWHIRRAQHEGISLQSRGGPRPLFVGARKREDVVGFALQLQTTARVIEA